MSYELTLKIFQMNYLIWLTAWYQEIKWARICAESNEEDENQLDSYLLNSEEEMLISQVPTSEEISIALAEGTKPSSILQDRYCEELDFPQIFSNGPFG